MTEIRKLLKRYSNFNDNSIRKIEDVSKVLKTISNLVQADVFIDCPTRDKDRAIVVAESKPEKKESLYKNSVVGKFALRENEPAAFRSMDLGVSTRDIKALTQENVNVTQTVEPIINDEGETIGVIIIEKDITDNMDSNEKVKILEMENAKLNDELEKYEHGNENQNITYHIDDAIIIFDVDGVVRFKNPVTEKLYKTLGYKEELIGMDFDNIALGNKSFKEVSELSEDYTEEVEIGDYVFQIKYIQQWNDVIYLGVLIKDVTDIKLKEKELIFKSVVIKEIHHRVKNNLQTIASLLRLQSRRVEDENFKSILQDSMNRIIAIASTHEILAQSGVDEVNIKSVLQRIMKSIKRGYALEDKNIEVNIIGDDFNVSSDKATDISLIINELVQNSLKYAFKNRESGKIDVVIKKGKMYSVVTVIDDGIGFDIKELKSKSLGLSIVKSVVKDKLKGELDISSSCDGTKISFDFINKIK